MTSPTDRSRPHARIAAFATACALLVAGGTAFAQDLESQRSEKEQMLDEVQAKGEVLSTEISGYTDEINQLAGDIATLRNREAIVAEELRETQARLVSERENLDLLRSRLGRSLNALSNRLVEIYKADQPDALTVILEADGFDDLVNRYDYLDRIQDQDAQIVSRVHNLRDASQEAVTQIRSARDSILLKREKLERTRANLEAREAELDAVRDEKAAALENVEATEDRLEGNISDLDQQIQAALREAQATTTETDPLPSGPVETDPSGYIWPVNGPVVSPFGQRWGRLHAGIDIAVPAGTPIHAVADGNIVLVQSDAESGGYGNYTCVDHGGGLSSCYAHQSSFAITSGSVSQGDVIGYVGCTGHCYGDHLHFEIRINGTPVDPLGYL